MTDPFAITQGRLGDWTGPSAASPLTRVAAPTGEPVWLVGDDALAKQVLTDPAITKDPAYAPATWRTWDLGLEPPGAIQPSLTTVDGEQHLRLRRAHAPLFTGRRLRGHTERIAEIARELLNQADSVDLAADFLMRFPLTVMCELLGVPQEHIDGIAAACKSLESSTCAAEVTASVDVINRLMGTAAATELRERLPAELTEDDVRYLLAGLVIAGQVTTQVALGFLIAYVLAGHDVDVDEVLLRHPPAPFTLWRFTTTEVELAGEVLPARSPILVNIEWLNAAGHDLTFGAGAHYCIGAQLAQIELSAVALVLRNEFPTARLAVPFADLPVLSLGVQGCRLTALPVHLR